MALIPRDFDLTFPDFESIKARLSNAILTAFSSWDNFDRAGFENILLESFCFNHDVFFKYQEQRIRETRLSTVVARPTARRLAKLHCGYTATEATAATATVTLTLSAVAVADVTIDAGTPIQTKGDNLVVGQLTTAKTITAGNLEIDGPWEQSTSVQETFTSSGLPRQAYYLNQAPYLAGSASVTDDGGAWTEADNFANSEPTDKHFVVVVTDDGYAQVRIGDGTYGAITTGTVTVDYKTGGGLAGRVPADSLTTIVGSFQDDLGNPVTVSVNNAAAAIGGTDAETVALIRTSAPASLAAQERSVGKSDIELNAERVPNVARVVALTLNERAGIPENTAHIYAVAYGTTTASGRYRPAAVSSGEKTAIHTMVNETYPVCVTFTTIEQDTDFTVVNVEMDIRVMEGYTPSTVATSIYNALDDLFAVALSDADGKAANTENDFGANMDNELTWGALFTTAKNVTGVRKVDEDTFEPVNDVYVDDWEFPQLGSVSITDVDSGQTWEF